MNPSRSRRQKNDSADTWWCHNTQIYTKNQENLIRKCKFRLFFSIDYFFVTVRSCCIETSRRWRQKLLQHRRRRRQNKTTWSKVSDVLNNGENRTRRRPARFISSAEAGTADSSLRQNLFRKVYFTHISDVFSFSLCCNVSETRRERQLDRFCSRPAQIIDPE